MRETNVVVRIDASKGFQKILYVDDITMFPHLVLYSAVKVAKTGTLFSRAFAKT